MNEIIDATTNETEKIMALYASYLMKFVITQMSDQVLEFSEGFP